MGNAHTSMQALMEMPENIYQGKPFFKNAYIRISECLKSNRLRGKQNEYVQIST